MYPQASFPNYDIFKNPALLGMIQEHVLLGKITATLRYSQTCIRTYKCTVVGKTGKQEELLVSLWLASHIRYVAECHNMWHVSALRHSCQSHTHKHKCLTTIRSWSASSSTCVTVICFVLQATCATIPLWYGYKRLTFFVFALKVLEIRFHAWRKQTGRGISICEKQTNKTWNEVQSLRGKCIKVRTLYNEEMIYSDILVNLWWMTGRK